MEGGRPRPLLMGVRPKIPDAAAARPGGVSPPRMRQPLLGFIVGKQTFDVLPVDQQLTLLITQGAVLGIGRTLFCNENVELGVQVFDLGSFLRPWSLKYRFASRCFSMSAFVLVVELS